MNTAGRIDTVEDFSILVQQALVVIVTSYREKWCPFCRTYLREFDSVRRNPPRSALLVGISVDTFDECKELQKKLKLGYDLIPDETLVMRQLLKVTTGKGHGKEAYLQPSVFVFKDGEKCFEWIQEPKLLNLGGAIGRLPVKAIVQKVTDISERKDKGINHP
ncbi:MAG: redoxin domain-containing protein [Halioglobus sp.]